MFLNRRTAARYRDLESIIPGPREILLELITNLNVILYLSTCHTLHIIVLILFMIMSQLSISIYVSLMYEIKKKIGKILTNKSVGTRPLFYENRIYRAAVSQRLRNTALSDISVQVSQQLKYMKLEKSQKNRFVTPLEYIVSCKRFL